MSSVPEWLSIAAGITAVIGAPLAVAALFYARAPGRTRDQRAHEEALRDRVRWEPDRHGGTHVLRHVGDEPAFGVSVGGFDVAPAVGPRVLSAAGVVAPGQAFRFIVEGSEQRGAPTSCVVSWHYRADLRDEPDSQRITLV